MPKAQLNARVSDLTRRQLDELGKRWGTTQTETLTVIIDRMYQQESQTMQKYSHRQEIIEKIAATICGKQLDDAAIERANRLGWAFDIRFTDGEYVSESDWTRVSDIHLDANEMATAKRIAAALEASL